MRYFRVFNRHFNTHHIYKISGSSYWFTHPAEKTKRWIKGRANHRNADDLIKAFEVNNAKFKELTDKEVFIEML